MTIPGITPPAGEEQETRTEGPGSRLRRGREALQLDLATAAAMLHLSEAKLAALENDRFDQLPGPVYVQGYLRNYARLLGESVEEVLEAYRAWDPTFDQAPKLEGKHRSTDRTGIYKAVRFATRLIALTLIVLSVLWLNNNGYLQQVKRMLSGEFADARTAISLGTPGIESSPQTNNSAATLPVQPDVPTERPTGTQQTSGAHQPIAVPEVVAPQPAAAPTTDAVVMDLREASWVEVKDATGKVQINDLLSAGSRKVLEGTPPFQVLLGNAAGVQITIGGRPFDLQPHTHANVARFTLDPGTIGTP
jgi:cytoskeleton protein RodZ